MKKLFQKTYFSFLIILLAILSCNKKEEQEPIIFNEAIIILKYNMHDIFDYNGHATIKYIIDHREGSCTNACRDGDTIKVFPIYNRIYYKIKFEWTDDIHLRTLGFGEVKEGTVEITDSIMTIICDENFFNIENCGGLGFLRFTLKDIPAEYQYNSNTEKYIYWSFVNDTVTFEDATAFYSADTRFCPATATKDEGRVWIFPLLDASKDCYFIIGRDYNGNPCTPEEILYVEKVETNSCQITEYTFLE